MKISVTTIVGALLASGSMAQALWLAPPPGPAPSSVAPSVVYQDAAPAAGSAVSPYRAQNDARGFYAEGSIFYGIGVSDVSDALPELGSLDMAGVEFTVGHRFNRFNAVNLRISYGYGDGGVSIYDPSWGSEIMDMQQHNFTLMPGYRFSLRPSHSPLELFFGVNAGLSIVSNYAEYSARKHGYAWGYYEYDGTEAGFAYSAEVGVKYHYSPWSYVFVAYEFRGTTAAPDVEDKYYSNDYIKTEAPMHHVIRIGGGMQF